MAMKCLLLLLLASTAAGGMLDLPIAASGPAMYLTNWSLSEDSLSLRLSATVPGDIITDLQSADIIGEPFYELNWRDNASMWNLSATRWTYEFPALPAGNLLVLESVKMGARVAVNGVELLNATNQFVRYLVPLPASSTGSPLTVTFDASLLIANRYTPCSGYWDWQAMSGLYRDEEAASWGRAATFSAGLVKGVYVLPVAPATLAITDVVALPRYLGSYPVGALIDGAHAGFNVSVRVHVWAPVGGAAGVFTAIGSWPSAVPVSSPVVASQAGESIAVTLWVPAPASAISLWWPNGLGAQPLYNISVQWTPSGAAAARGVVVSTSRRLGFRVPALVTVNDTNATLVQQDASADGSGTFGMFIRVNGQAVWARGANLVPLESLEGRETADAYAVLVRSAAAAHMTMLRVWGGGQYPPDALFDACDEAGLLLYVDMMFAGSGHDLAAAVAAAGPLPAGANASIEAEVVHQVRRLSHHPSVFLYDGANEVIVQRSGPTALYASQVIAAIAREDPTRVVWPSSPAAGWLSGVSRLYGTPSGTPLVALVGSQPHIWDAGNERHGPYQAGVGAPPWQTIMRDPWSGATTFDPGMPTQYLSPGDSPRGAAAPSIFISEFGAVSMASFEAFSATLAPGSWGLHGGGVAENCTATPGVFINDCVGRNAMAQRNWPCDSLIWSYFGPALLNASGEVAFKAQLYLCQLASALNMQQNILGRRAAADNELGHLVWQLNDIWNTGSWGSLEYGGAGQPGVLRGGRWKPLHSFLAGFLFTDATASCGFVGRAQRDFVCYVSNAGALPFAGTLTLLAASVAAGAGAPAVWAQLPVAVGAGPGAVTWLTPNATVPNSTTTVILARLTNVDGTLAAAEHMVHLAPPRAIAIERATLSAAVAPAASADGSVNVTVSAEGAMALWVCLTAAAEGRFEDNAFTLVPGQPRTLRWLPFSPGGAPGDAILLAQTLRVEDFSMYALGHSGAAAARYM